MPTKNILGTKCRVVFSSMTIVLIANEMNLSIFKPLWMCQSDILQQGEITGEVVISPAAIEIPTPRFRLTILPNRVQLALSPDDIGAAEAAIGRIVGGILRTLPHTPFAAMGMNFDFFVTPCGEVSFDEWNCAAFASPAALHVATGGENPRFGSYTSFDFEGFRLKLDAKPVAASAELTGVGKLLDGASNWMHLGFNYHRELDQNRRSAHAIEMLPKWPSVVSHARAIANKVGS